MHGDWWMFHGDLSHSGEAADTQITAENAATLRRLHSIDVPGSILSTPAVVDGCVFVGLANTLEVATQNGGQLLKIDLESGETLATFHWAIPQGERDTHGFCGMGCTPAVADGRVVFSAFNGKLYCLSEDDLRPQWVTDLRYADLVHNQPVTNDFGGDGPDDAKASGWSSPVLHGDRVYVGMGEGENPQLYGFVYCLDANTGDVIWIFCTCEFEEGRPNRPNELPKNTVTDLPKGFTTFDGDIAVKGASVWSSIAYDPDLDQLYCATGNPKPDGPLPTAGYTNSVVVLRGSTGELLASVQIPARSSYRPSDIDVDIGGSPTLYELDGRKLVGIGCKNGAYVTFDAHSYEIVAVRQLLPLHRDGTQIATVDARGPDDPSVIGPTPSNKESNETLGENYSGTYSTAAVCSSQGKLFIGVGGNNYHFRGPGIDSLTTPFIRALDWSTLHDAWPLDDGDPQRYAIALQQAANPLYKMAGESGISVPAVAGDVVFMSTTRVALYAFSAHDGELLWADVDGFGPQTGGMHGGYGYCMGPAVAGNYVVAGALVAGPSAGVLNIYSLPGAAG
jgi:outer membrane protein assembly factor BamB